MHVGSVIRRLRAERNVTQEYIAQKLNISVTTYGNIERNDVKRLTIHRLGEIANVLGVHIFELFGAKEIAAFKDVNLKKDKASLRMTKEIRKQMRENNAMLRKLIEMQELLPCRAHAP